MFIKKNLWCQVFCRSTESISGVILRKIGLRKSEVAQSNVTVVVKKDILRFQITGRGSITDVKPCCKLTDSPIHNIVVMKMLQGQEELSGVESASLLIEALLLLKMMEQLSAIHKPIPRSSKNSDHRRSSGSLLTQGRGTASVLIGS